MSGRLANVSTTPIILLVPGDLGALQLPRAFVVSTGRSRAKLAPLLAELLWDGSWLLIFFRVVDERRVVKLLRWLPAISTDCWYLLFPSGAYLTYP